MSEKRVMTPVEKPAAPDVPAEPMVDIRRKLIREVGIDTRLAHLPHKVTDRKGDDEPPRVSAPGLLVNTRLLKGQIPGRRHDPT